MKALKIFLITSFILLLAASATVGYVWFKLQAPAMDSQKSNSAEAAEGIRIDTSSVTDDQKALAEKVGINLDEVVITKEMISCAEQKLGAERLQEISDGDSPTTIESISLLGCL